MKCSTIHIKLLQMSERGVKSPRLVQIGGGEMWGDYETTIFTFLEELPHFAVIIAEPLPLAVMLPAEETVTTELLLLFHVTVPPLVTVAPSESVLPFARFMLM